jgi:hypothetical protein
MQLKVIIFGPLYDVLNQKNINSIPKIGDEDGIVAETYEEKAAILARTVQRMIVELGFEGEWLRAGH